MRREIWHGTGRRFLGVQASREAQLLLFAFRQSPRAFVAVATLFAASDLA